MGKSKFQSLQVDDGQEVRLTLPEPYREGYWQISDDRGKAWKRLQVEQGAVLIFNATLDDNGLIYRAKVGRDLYSTPVKLRVQSCPKITQPPENIQTTEGSSVTFSVQATDTSGCPLSYQWQKNGKDIRRAHNSTLEIPFVTTFNVGTYTVIVSNEHCCTSASAELSLSIETPEQPQELQSLVINRGILRTSRPHHQTKKTVQIKEPTPSSSSSASNEYLNDLSERLLHSQLEITKAQTTPDKSAEQEGPEKEWHDFVAQHNKESSTITVPISVPLDTVLEQQDLEEEDNLKESEHAVREALDKAFEEKKAEENALAKAKETSEHAIREALDKALAEEQALKEEALKEAEEKALKEAEEQALREEEAALKEAEARALQEEQEEAAYRLAEEEAFKRIEESLKREEEIARELEKAKLEQDLILAEARKLAEEREAAETKKAPQEVSDEKEVVSEETISEKEVVSEEKEESPEEKEDDEETTLEDESSTPAPVSKLVQA